MFKVFMAHAKKFFKNDKTHGDSLVEFTGNIWKDPRLDPSTMILMLDHLVNQLDPENAQHYQEHAIYFVLKASISNFETKKTLINEMIKKGHPLFDSFSTFYNHTKNDPRMFGYLVSLEIAAYDKSLIACLAKDNNIQYLEMAIRNPHINLDISDGVWSPLMHAVHNGHWDFAQMLVNAGATITENVRISVSLAKRKPLVKTAHIPRGTSSSHESFHAHHAVSVEPAPPPYHSAAAAHSHSTASHNRGKSWKFRCNRSTH